jgi:hypothetical protein
MATITFCDRCKSENVTSVMNLYINLPKGQPFATNPTPDMRVDLCPACVDNLEKFVRQYDKVESNGTVQG